MPASGERPSDPSAQAWQQAFELLDDALDLSASEQAAWLAALGPEQARLKPMVEQLLRSRMALGTGDFMGTPAHFVLAEGTQPRPSMAQALIGPYRLLRQIGQGGMADVWLAVRADGLLERQVALKLPHASWGGAMHAERMARERHILASLTHPHIARLYDAGIGDDGRPYLALEYVAGQPIDEYARIQALAVRARVELLVQVARAVAHAHAHLVVHRDIKPSNILVDAAGQARLLDFGIAKIIDRSLDEEAPGSPLTQLHGRAMTPDYASPEQIRGDTMGTASDVYSLGIVMFELLAGERPYRLPTGLGAVALAEAVARATVPRLSTVAADRAVRRQLEGDLDAIAARALARASDERYATMDALADDLERHLAGLPVRARPDSRWYLAERWVRRHKIETAIVAAVVVALLGGAYAQVLVLLALATGTTAALWQRNRALRQAERASAALARAEQVKDFIASIFTQAVPRAGKGGAVTAADLLQVASRRLDTDLAALPDVAAELGVLIGSSFNELGAFRAGLDWLPRVVERCTRALGPIHPLTLQARWRLVEAANTLGELAISDPLLDTLLSDARRAQPPQPRLLAKVLRSLAFVHTKRDREPQAMAALHEAVEISTRKLGEASEEALISICSLSNTLVHFGQVEAALRVIEPVLPAARSAYGASRPHPILVMVERCAAEALARNNRPRDAVAMLRQIVEDQRSLDAGDTARVRTMMTTLGQALIFGGHFDEASEVLTRADALHTQLTGGVNDEGLTLATLCVVIASLRGDVEAAQQHLARRAERLSQHDRPDPFADDTALAHVLVLTTAGKAAAALVAADALASRPNRLTTGGALRLRRLRAQALRQLGSIGSAREVAAQAAQLALASPAIGLERGLVLAEAARCSLAGGDPAEAAQCFASALAVWKSTQVDGPALIAGVQREIEALAIETIRDNPPR